MSKGLIIYLTVIISIGIIAGIVIVIMSLKYRKKTPRTASVKTSGNKDGLTAKKRLPLEDTKKFISAIEDIKDGIIITDNYTRFITGITCRGVDLYNEPRTEQISIMNNYTPFFNILDDPIQYRMYSKAFDIDFSKNKYQSKIDEFSEQFRLLEKEHVLAVDKKDAARAAAIKSDMEFLSGRIVHLLEQLNALEVFSDVSYVQDEQQEYIFEWNYVRESGDVELTKAEIFEKAKKELDIIASQKIDALAASGVKAKRFTHDDMEDSCRHVSKPYTADEFNQKLVSSSDFEADVITSASKHVMEDYVEDEFKESFGEDMFSDEVLFGNSGSKGGE